MAWLKKNLRWLVCALLFLGTTVNYIDRQVLGLLKSTLQDQFHFDERQYAAIVFSFQLAYALGLFFSGRFIDRVGTRLGLALAVGVWSAAAVAHAAAALFPGLSLPSLILSPPSVVLLTGAVAGLALARFLLGLAEAANFPASIKTVAEWFPKRERALATGIFNSGSNVGALVTPLVVPWLVLHWGWQGAFIATGLVGFAWLALWLPFYRAPKEHPGLSRAELKLILSDPPEKVPRPGGPSLARHPMALAFALGKFLTDPVWWVFLFWIPDFLKRQHQLELPSMGAPIVAIYLAADAGSIGGGWLSSRLIKAGFKPLKARLSAMLACALAVTPIVLAAGGLGLWPSVALIALAAAAHQGWSANLFTLVSDHFPRAKVATVTGAGGMAGAIGGMFIALAVGEVLQRTGSYALIFAFAASAYLVAWACIALLSRVKAARA